MQACKQNSGSHLTLPTNRNKHSVNLNGPNNMVGIYLDNCIRICAIFFASDLIYRLFLCFSEYIYYVNRYLPLQHFPRISIIKRCFSYSNAWKTCGAAILLVFLLRFSETRKFPLVYTDLLYMPLYWVLRVLQSPHSNLDYAKWIRASHGLDYGEGMASNYFHGYLLLILPSHQSGHRGIRERIELYSSQHNVEFVTDRFVILIPDIMYVAPKIESRILEKATPLDIEIRNRAGVYRPYKSDVYRFTEKINDKFYYIAMEGATPLLSFYEAMNSNYTSTWQMREMHREILFKFSQSLKKMINEDPKTRNKIEIVLYSAITEDGRNVDVGDVLKAHFEKELQRC